MARAKAKAIEFNSFCSEYGEGVGEGTNIIRIHLLCFVYLFV